MTRPKYPKQAELMEVFEYIDGELWRKEYVSADGRNIPRKLVENVANNCDGYCQVTFKARKVFFHAIVKILVDRDAKPGEIVDHDDGDPLNNSPSNLIWKSVRGNSQNRRENREGKPPGITWCKLTGKWMAQIKVDGKRIYLGRFDTPLEAFDAYIQANRDYGFPVDHLLKMRAEYIERNAA